MIELCSYLSWINKGDLKDVRYFLLKKIQNTFVFWISYLKRCLN